MGLLTVGTPLTWSEIRPYVDLIKEKGITQFINVYNSIKDRQHDCLKWGDEVEFILVKFDHEKKRVYLSLKAHELLPILNQPEHDDPDNCESFWRPEYADYMVEGTPGKPYESEVSNYNLVEPNMRLRREQVQQLLGENEYILSLTTFPLIGCKNFTWPNYEPTPTAGITHSLFYPDKAIFPGHPRFMSLSRNIRERRKAKVAINVPIFKDTNTQNPFIENLEQYGDVNGESASAAQPDHIYLDAMGFGMGCSCLQMTFQAQNIEEARHLYDQLTPLTPIILALSASSPIWRGYLVDTDCRWNIISASVDDRTAEERGEIPLKENKHRIYKSRYDTTDCYLSEKGERYNDVKLVKDEQIYERLLENGIDKLLAQHVAHLFIRDPVSLFKEKIHINDEVETDHFENIQSTNWQNMRFKPPPSKSPIGWRVEFRPTELQITDFENAAFATFIVLLTRAILSFKLNFLIPISKVNENMKTAQKRNACSTQKFYFRKSIFTKPKLSPSSSLTHAHSRHNSDDDNRSGQNSVLNNSHHNGDQNGDEEISIDDEYELMTLNEIVNGNEKFPGFIQLIKDYLADINVDVDTQCTIKKYLRLIERRANGTLMTSAGWIREFVTTHPKYMHDSHVTDEIAYDLLWEITLISFGKKRCPKFIYYLD